MDQSVEGIQYNQPIENRQAGGWMDKPTDGLINDKQRMFKQARQAVKLSRT